LKQTFGNQECINRWNYQSSGAPGSSSAAYALVDALGFIEHGSPPAYPEDGLFAALGAMQSTLVFYQQIFAKNVYDPTDFYDLPLPPSTHGQNAGNPMSPINAFGFYSSRTRLDINRATKRFVGVCDEDDSGGGTISSVAAGRMAVVNTIMGDTLNYTDGGATLSFAPIVVGKEKYTTPRGNTAYKYYPTEAAQLAHIMVGISWNAYASVRSQVSRQYGKGA
jgi:hypothetical protein